MEDGKYFDSYGRCIPGDIKGAHHVNTRRYFILQQQILDYPAIYARLVKHLRMENMISLDAFLTRTESILDMLRRNSQCKNILNGVHIPFMLPVSEDSDIGEMMEEKYINAVKSSFEETYPARQFVNHHKTGLSGKLTIAPDSRHNTVLDAMKEKAIVGYYFPCLLEYSVPAAIEKISSLPDIFHLAGGYDTAAALVGSPWLLMRPDGYPPLLWLAGFKAEQEEIGYHFEAYGYNPTFNRRKHFNKCAESWGSGLVVIG